MEAPAAWGYYGAGERKVTSTETSMISSRPASLMVEDLTDPVELAKARAQHERFERNWAWFEKQAPEVYAHHRGKCICVAGEGLFVADTSTEAVALAAAAHPEDDGRFTLYIPRERMYRVYANHRRLDAVQRWDPPAGDSGRTMFADAANDRHHSALPARCCREPTGATPRRP